MLAGPRGVWCLLLVAVVTLATDEPEAAGAPPRLGKGPSAGRPPALSGEPLRSKEGMRVPNTPENRRLALALWRKEAEEERDLEADSGAESPRSRNTGSSYSSADLGGAETGDGDHSGGVAAGADEGTWRDRMEGAELASEKELADMIAGLEATRAAGELDDAAKGDAIKVLRNLRMRKEAARLGLDRVWSVRSGVESGADRDDGGASGPTRVAGTDGEPFPSAFPHLDHASTASCTTSAYCETHFFPVLEAHVSSLVGEGGMDMGDARELSCTECVEFLCCEMDSPLYFTYKRDRARACPAHCRSLSEDFDQLVYYHWMELGPEDVDYSYFREYMRAITDANFKAFHDKDFLAFRSILYKLRSAQSPVLARAVRSLPAEDFELLAVGGGSHLYTFSIGKDRFVVKRVTTYSTELEDTLVNEVNANEVLRWSKNPHIVKYYGYYVQFNMEEVEYMNKHVHLVFEMCQGGDLASLWEGRKDELRARPDIVADLFAQMVVGLQDFSMNRIAHRDLKMDNLFVAFEVDPDRPLKVGDIQVMVGDLDRAVMWPHAGAEGDSPLQESKDTTNSMYYEALDGRLTVGMDTVESYPQELTTIRDSLMPPEALLAAIGKTLKTDHFFTLAKSIPIRKLSALVPNLDRPTVTSMIDGLKTVDPRLLAKYDVWQLGIVALQLLTGESDPVSHAAERMKTRKIVMSTGRAHSVVSEHRVAPEVPPSLCSRTGSAERHAICYLEEQAATFGDRKTGDTALKQLLLGLNDGAMIYASLERVFEFNPNRRIGVQELAGQPFLVDSIDHVRMNDRYVDWPAPSLEGLEGATPAPRMHDRNRWEECSLLSFSGSPVSPLPSIRSHSVRSVESATRLLAGSTPTSPRASDDESYVYTSEDSLPFNRPGASEGPDVTTPVVKDGDQDEISSEGGAGAGLRGQLGLQSHPDGPRSESSTSVLGATDHPESPFGDGPAVSQAAVPTLSYNQDSPYSALFYFNEMPWEAAAPPTVLPTRDDRIRTDLKSRREVGEALARAYPGHSVLSGERDHRYPEVSYDVDPLVSGEYEYHRDRFDAMKFTDVSVREVKHFFTEEEVFEEMGVSTGIFDRRPFVHESMYGYLVAHVEIELEFEDTTRRPDAIVIGYAYGNNELVARPLDNSGWVRVCDGLPGSASDYELKDLDEAATCPNSIHKTKNKRIGLKLLVEEPFLGTWTLRLFTRLQGSRSERCSSVEVASPVNILDVRWDTKTANALLMGDSERRRLSCNACMHVWAAALRSLSIFVPRKNLFYQHDFKCDGGDVECKAGRRELRRLLSRVPRRHRDDRDFDLSSLHKSGAVVTKEVCAEARAARIQDADVTPVDPSAGLEQFPKCPGYEAYPNVLPRYAPTDVYRGWYMKARCEMCRFVVTSARGMWRLDKSRRAYPDACTTKMTNWLLTQHGVYASLDRIWPSHYRGKVDAPSALRDPASWDSLLMGIAKHALRAEALMCAMPWIELEAQLCHSIQESVIDGVVAATDLAEAEANLADPVAYCRRLHCCTG